MNGARGFTLLEVLVSLVIISVILLSLAAMQIHAMRESRFAGYYLIATRQFVNISERLTALQNLQGLNREITQWNNENQQLLPHGSGTVTGKYPDYIITVYWGDKTHDCQKMQTGASGCLRKKIQVVSR